MTVLVINAAAKFKVNLTYLCKKDKVLPLLYWRFFHLQLTCFQTCITCKCCCNAFRMSTRLTCALEKSSREKSGDKNGSNFQFSCYKILTKIFGRIESCPKEKESFEQNVPTTSISKYKWFLGYGKISFMVLVTGLIITILKTQI